MKETNYEGATQADIITYTTLATGMLAFGFWQIYGLSAAWLLEFLGATGLFSFPIFLMFFLATPLDRIRSNRLSRWLVANQQQSRLAFALIYAYHFVASLGLRWIAGDWVLDGLMLRYSVVALGFLSLATGASLQVWKKMFPVSGWQTCNTLGMYGVCVFFQLEFLTKAQKTGSSFYWSLTLTALAAIVIRSLNWRNSYRRSPTASKNIPSSHLLSSGSKSNSSSIRTNSYR